MKKYLKYKKSGIEWVGEIPVDWKIKQLKHLAEVMPSNVDKKSQEDEQKIFLCNYVDVYKNNFITSDLNFMEATASDSQIEKFTLQKGDVIATKDSEDSNDIAIPALVKEDFKNVVCGYHLTLMRCNKKDLIGDYLYWLIYSKNYNHYFSLEANGVTRYGIGTYSFKNVNIVFPKIEEQRQIANYLNYKTNQIETLITNKKELIALLYEERIATINHAVTKGINPKTKLKPSGIDWLGNVPESWEVKKLKYLLRTTKGFAFKSDLFIEKGIPVVKASDIKNKSIRAETTHYISESIAQNYESVKLSMGDILITTVGSTPDVINSAVGQIGKVPKSFEGALLNQNTVRLEISDKSKLISDYLFFLIQNDNYRSHLNLHAHGTANQASLKLVDILNYTIALPSLIEQKEIIKYVDKEQNRIDTIIIKTEQEIELMKEYKTALISEVVTGKVDVRDEKLG